MKYKILITGPDGIQEFESNDFCIINQDGLGWAPHGNMMDFIRAWVQASKMPTTGEEDVLDMGSPMEKDEPAPTRRKPTRADLEFLKRKIKHLRGK